MSQFFKTREETEAWLKEMGVKDYTVRDDLTVDVKNNVDLGYCGIKAFPVRFGKVDGTFSCHNNRLSTLAGAPASVDGTFSCHNNQLTTLFGSPASVGGGFWCCDNHLTTLAGAPSWVGTDFFSDFSEADLRWQIKALFAEGRGFYAKHMVTLCSEIRAEMAAEAMASALGEAGHEPVVAKRKAGRA